VETSAIREPHEGKKPVPAAESAWLIYGGCRLRGWPDQVRLGPLDYLQLIALHAYCRAAPGGSPEGHPRVTDPEIYSLPGSSALIGLQGLTSMQSKSLRGRTEARLRSIQGPFILGESRAGRWLPTDRTRESGLSH
jgi:hypothetical protein